MGRKPSGLPTKTTASVRLTAILMAWVQAQATARGTTVSAVIAAAVRAAMGHPETIGHHLDPTHVPGPPTGTGQGPPAGHTLGTIEGNYILECES